MHATGKPCKYCKMTKDNLESYKCDTCYSLSHLACMKCKKPSRLKGDLLFLYQCKDCNFQQKDTLTRMKLSWVQVIHLALYNLTVVERGRQGFFRWKEEICGFIEKHWNTLMPGRSKAPTWVGTIAGTLSVHSHNLFKSGQTAFNETGWWALQEVSIPKANPENYRISRSSSKNTPDHEPLQAKFDMNANSEYGRGKRQRKTRDKKDEFQSSAKISKLEEPKVKTIPLMLPAKVLPTPASCVNAVKTKKGGDTNKLDRNKKSQNNHVSKKIKSSDTTPTSTTEKKSQQVLNRIDSQTNSLNKQQCSTADSTKGKESSDKTFNTGSCAIMDELSKAGYSNAVQYDDPFAALFDDMSVFDMPSIKEEPICEKTMEVPVNPPNSCPPAKFAIPELPSGKAVSITTAPIEMTSKKVAKQPSLPPFVPPLTNLDAIKPIEKSEDVKQLTVKEEHEFLAKINNHPLTVESDCSVRRLRRKLMNRKLKRDLGVPLFAVDNKRKLETVEPNQSKEHKPMTTFEAVDSDEKRKFSESSVDPRKQSLHHPALKDVNVLDKFCNFMPQNVNNKLRNTPTNRRFISLIGIAEDICGYRNSIISPYTSRVLKPYIRRDFSTLPPKLKLLRDIQERCQVAMHRTWPIDYCYVQPIHIPAVNSLCSDFFWPGIDMTECLQYPEFSSVVLYRKLVIGFAFMVPDVKFNEAYISFIFVHPDWRRSGIATNMIYHLIQTCMGKDITLHVSPTNPSMLLYQKFGFKAEALILDFYKKYLPEEDKSSKHAFLLRLQR